MGKKLIPQQQRETFNYKSKSIKVVNVLNKYQAIYDISLNHPV